jgi:hypothetical protein
MNRVLAAGRSLRVMASSLLRVPFVRLSPQVLDARLTRSPLQPRAVPNMARSARRGSVGNAAPSMVGRAIFMSASASAAAGEGASLASRAAATAVPPLIAKFLSVLPPVCFMFMQLSG